MRLAGTFALFLTVVFASPAHSQIDDSFVERALRLPRPPPRYIQNVKFGMRSVTFNQFTIAPSDPKALYVTSFHGFVFGSTNGGMSWNEGRLITQRVKFFGAIRPSLAPGGAPFDASRAFRGAKSRGFLNYRLRDIGLFSSGTTGVNYLDQDNEGTSPFESAPVPRGLRLAGDYTFRGRAAGGGDEGDSSRYGIGLTRAAVRLQALLKKKRARLIGLNLKLLLNLRGVEPTWITHVAVHPTNAKIALAASSMGLFKTTDGGVGWDLVFPGRTLRERWVNHVIYDPRDPKKVIIATGQGVMISRDGGQKFARPTGTQLSTAYSTWVEVFPGNPDIMFAGTNIGAFRSDDGGVTWRWVFFETLASANRLSCITIHPTNANRVTLSTFDGLFRSSNGGKSWRRSGEFLFTSMKVFRVRTNPNNGEHLVAITYRRVWESFDGGKTWGAMYINDSEWSPRDIAFDPHHKNVFWVLTSGELLRLSPTPPTQPSDKGLANYHKRRRVEPSLSQAMDSTFRNFGVHRGQLSELRKRSSWRHFIPRLHAAAGFMSFDASMALDATYAGNAFVGVSNPRLGLDHLARFYANNQAIVMNRNQRVNFPYWGVFLTWDFSGLLFDMEEAPYGRYFTQTNALYLRLKFEVQRLFEERRRVLIKLLAMPPADIRSLLSLRMRLEELTAHLNALTGGLYDESVVWLESQPWLGSSEDKPSSDRSTTKNEKTSKP
jgi:hypothetical protein